MIIIHSLMTIRNFSERLTVLFILLTLLACTKQETSDRPVKQLELPDGHIIMVAEGDQEPRSIGSYSIRLYSGAEPKFPTDDFLYGLIRPRDGSIEDVRLDASANKKNPSIIVIIRSAGSGGYLSADQFQLNKNEQLELVNTVTDLDHNSDPVKTLQKRTLSR